MKNNEWALSAVKDKVVNEKAKSFQLRKYQENVEKSEALVFKSVFYSVILLLIALGFSSEFFFFLSGIGFAAGFVEYSLNTLPNKALAQAAIYVHQDPELLKIIQENNCPSYIPERKNVQKEPRL